MNTLKNGHVHVPVKSNDIIGSIYAQYLSERRTEDRKIRVGMWVSVGLYFVGALIALAASIISLVRVLVP